jgi:GntR family transcriptional regulator
MILFNINPQSGMPAYRQLMEQVKYYVASGILPPGSKLPSIRELAKALCVNPATVVKAYSELGHERVIDMQHGRGVFVGETGKQITDSQREEILRPLARQLAVEAWQVGADAGLVARLVAGESQRLRDTAAAQPEITGEENHDESGS